MVLVVAFFSSSFNLLSANVLAKKEMRRELSDFGEMVEAVVRAPIAFLHACRGPLCWDISLQTKDKVSL